MSKYIRAYLAKFKPREITLLLNDNDLGDGRASVLLSVFDDHPEVTRINLSSNSRLALGSARTCAALVKIIGFRTLTHLNLGGLGLGDRVERLLTAMEGNPTIRSLCLSGNDLRGSFVAV